MLRSARATPWRMRVDPIACDGFGYCAELVPELVWLDEWGYPVLDDADVPPHFRSLAEQAVRSCPRKALLLERIPREGISGGSARPEKPTPAGTPGRPTRQVAKPRVVVLAAGTRVVASNDPGRRRVQYPAP